MNKTILIVIGIACAVITAGIMLYDYNDPINVARRHIRDKYYSGAFSTLSKLEDKDITNLLQDSDPEVRYLAVSILGNHKAKESIPEITKLLQDDVPDVRAAAICILGALEAKEAIPEIKKLLKDENEDVRQWAEFFLKRLGVPVERERNPASSGEEEIQKAKEGE